MRIYIFGDSITQGFYDPSGGWANKLAATIHEESHRSMLEGKDGYSEVYNLGVSGDTISGIQKRLVSELEPRRLYEDEEIIVIAAGTNDAVLRDNVVQIEEYEFEKQVDKLLDVALQQTRRVLCLSLAPVDERLTDPWKYSKSGKQWRNNRIDLFEDILKQVSLRRGVKFIPIYNTLSNEMKKGVAIHADGLHPNSTGHRIIEELIRPYVQEMVI